MTMQQTAGICPSTPDQPLLNLALSWTRSSALPTKFSAGSGLLLMVLAAPPLMIAPVTPAHAQESCQVQETSLRAAINSYANSCSLPRVDCDPFDGQWICASFNMSGNVPPQIGQTTILPTSDSPAQCEFSGPTLNAARIGYASNCGLPRVDCDPDGGLWTCASYQLGALSPANRGSGSTGSSSPTEPDITESSIPTSPNDVGSTGFIYTGDFGPPRRAWADSYSANGRCYIASNFDHGIGDVLVNTPAGSRTVRQVAAALGDGPGVGNNPIYNDVQCGNGPANNAGDEDINQCPGRVDLGAEGCSWRGPLWDLSVFAQTSEPVEEATEDEPSEAPSNTPVQLPNPGPSNAKSSLPNDSRYQPGDLISLFYDNGGDRDDGHATVAGKMVVSYYGLRDTLHIVNGTYYERAPGSYNPDSELVMTTTWGAEGNNDTWWNADARRDMVRTLTANRWRETLEAGRRVWVAEGGPSDFTASVLRLLESSTNLDLRNINVVQHSLVNEAHTLPENLADTERLTTYHRIGDGNFGGNSTPDLFQTNDAVARRFLSDPEFGDQWRAAFDYLPVFDCDRSQQRTCKFDGSDAVELMWIVGDESDEIQGWSDFANRYAN